MKELVKSTQPLLKTAKKRICKPVWLSAKYHREFSVPECRKERLYKGFVNSVIKAERTGKSAAAGLTKIVGDEGMEL